MPLTNSCQNLLHIRFILPGEGCEFAGRVNTRDVLGPRLAQATVGTDLSQLSQGVNLEDPAPRLPRLPMWPVLLKLGRSWPLDAPWPKMAPCFGSNALHLCTPALVWCVPSRSPSFTVLTCAQPREVKIRELSFWQSSMVSSVGPGATMGQDVGYKWL